MGQRTAKTKVVQKNDNKSRSKTSSSSKIKRQVKTLRGTGKEGSFAFFNSLSLFNEKRLEVKEFMEVSLVSLTFRARTLFKIF